jgi:transposase InsO family protein
VDRATRCIVAWAVCTNRATKVMKSVGDAAPHAARYYSGAINTYREPC